MHLCMHRLTHARICGAGVCLCGVYVQPSSLSYVVKEIAFRGVQMNTSFLQFWVALFQFFVGFALLPLTSLPLLGQGKP